MSSRDNLNAQLEHLQSKYVGTGHSDTTKYEWAVNHQRDSLASYVGHHSLISYFCIAENSSLGRKRYELIERMYRPCGIPPPKEEEST